MQQPATATHIPLDIIEEFLSHLPASDKRTLASAAQVSSSWLGPAQRRLFANIAVRPVPDAGLAKMAQSEHSDHLLGLVRGVHFSSPEQLKGKPAEHTAYRIPSSLIRPLARATNLTAIHFSCTFSWNDLSKKEVEAFAAVLSLPTLREISSHPPLNCPLPFPILLYCPNIQRVGMRCPNMGEYFNEDDIFPGFLDALAKVGHLQPPVLHYLNLGDTDLIRAFLRFAAKRKWSFQNGLEKLVLDYIDVPSSNVVNVTPSKIVGSFLREVGSTLKKLRLNVMRPSE